MVGIHGSHIDAASWNIVAAPMSIIWGITLVSQILRYLMYNSIYFKYVYNSNQVSSGNRNTL